MSGNEAALHLELVMRGPQWWLVPECNGTRARLIPEGEMKLTVKECVKCGAPLPPGEVEHRCEFCGTVVVFALTDTTVAVAPKATVVSVVPKAAVVSVAPKATVVAVPPLESFTFAEGGIRIADGVLLLRDTPPIPLSDIKAVRTNFRPRESFLPWVSLFAGAVSLVSFVVTCAYPAAGFVAVLASAILWWSTRRQKRLDLVVDTMTDTYPVLHTRNHVLGQRVRDAIAYARGDRSKYRSHRPT